MFRGRNGIRIEVGSILVSIAISIFHKLITISLGDRSIGSSIVRKVEPSNVVTTVDNWDAELRHQIETNTNISFTIKKKKGKQKRSYSKLCRKSSTLI